MKLTHILCNTASLVNAELVFGQRQLLLRVE